MQKYLVLSGFFMKYSAPLGLPFCASCAMCLGLFQEFACMPRDHPGLPHSSRARQQCAQKCICTFYPGRCLETLFFKHTLPVGLSATPHASVFECCLCVVLFFKKKRLFNNQPDFQTFPRFLLYKWFGGPFSCHHHNTRRASAVAKVRSPLLPKKQLPTSNGPTVGQCLLRSKWSQLGGHWWRMLKTQPATVIPFKTSRGLHEQSFAPWQDDELN